MAHYDVIILGGGPGGLTAAERLGRAGRSVLLLDPATIGGAAVNGGRVPIRALWQAASRYQRAMTSQQWGVTIGEASFDWTAMRAWQAHATAGETTRHVQRLRDYGVTINPVAGKLLGSGLVEVDGWIHTAGDIIIATGAGPAHPTMTGILDNPAVRDPAGLINGDTVPERLTVIGGGVVGLEYAALFSHLGSHVTLVEEAPEIMAFAEPVVARAMREALPQIDFRLERVVAAVRGDSIVASYHGSPEQWGADVILLATGRPPLVEGWGACDAGLKYSAKGVATDDCLRTNLSHVWAVGDVTGRSRLADAAHRMGEVVAALILDPTAALRGQRVRWDAIPWTVVAGPEAAGVGLTVAEAARRGLAVDTGTARVGSLEPGYFGIAAEALVEVVAERATRVVRGVHMLGAGSAAMSWGAAAVVEMEFTIDDVRQLGFAHATVADGLWEAIWAYPDRPGPEEGIIP